MKDAETLIGGFIGALIGFAGAWFVSWMKDRNAAYAQLGAIMLNLGWKLRYSDGGTIYQILSPHYQDILNAVWNAHRHTIIPRHRRRLLKLCSQLLGHWGGNRHSYTFPEKTVAETAIDGILQLVRCPYPQNWGPCDTAHQQNSGTGA